MKNQWLWMGLVSGLGLAGLAGCNHCCRRNCPPETCAARPPLTVGSAHALAPLGAVPAADPVYSTPPRPPASGNIPLPPPDNRYYGTPAPPPPSPPENKSWTPAPGGAVIYPENSPPTGSVRLLPPEKSEPPPVAAKVAPAPLPPVATKSEPPPPAPPDNSGIASLPVGIAQFTVARDRVASGLRPSIEGLDWLQSNGYRSVLHLRATGQDDSADRKEIESRGLKFFSLEVSPLTLNRQVVDEFNRLVTDKANLPLFVYDRDGALSGGLWYLHFRLADHESDDVARMKAVRLGLKQDGDHRDMWLAIQKFLAEQPR